jgi:dolichol-phosphate mannosyltransferase
MTSTATEQSRAQGEGPVLSIVVPTYHEVENLPELLDRLGRVRADGMDLEVLIMDDNSRDGSEEAVAALGLPWVRFVVRTENRGLSPAVIDGFNLAAGTIILVMDADLSHPPEKIPEMLAALDGGADFVIGSRYVPGASTAEDWGVMRWVNSRIATLLARPFTRVSDPMSGFFAFRRALLDAAAPFNAVGYKIGLEVIVKGRCRQCAEVPIHFDQRHHGESKLSLREQLLYLRHLRRLAMFKFGHWVHFSQFALVGFLGTFVNLAVLTVLDEVGLPLQISAAAAIFVAMVFNFFLNRRFTFSDAQPGHLWKQLAAFIAACSVGAAVNYAVVLSAAWMWPLFSEHPQFAAVLGILAGLTFNYVASRHLVFKK